MKLLMFVRFVWRVFRLALYMHRNGLEIKNALPGVTTHTPAGDRPGLHLVVPWGNAFNDETWKHALAIASRIAPESAIVKQSAAVSSVILHNAKWNGTITLPGTPLFGVHQGQ